MLLKSRVTFQQERVAFLQQQLQKEEETAAAAKTRLEQAQASRIAAEEELAKQEALFAEKQVIPPPASCIRYSTDSSCENRIETGFPLTHTHTDSHPRSGFNAHAGSICAREREGCAERAGVRGPQTAGAGVAGFFVSA
jgi:hypothetical protein